MLQLQYHYLSGTSQQGRLRLAGRDGFLPETGMVNLIPVSYSRTLQSLGSMSPDLLIATWSLSEGSRESQLAVIKDAFFGAKQILFGHYAHANTLIPETDKMTFPGYETEYNGPCFFSRDEVERYHFLRQATGRSSTLSV